MAIIRMRDHLYDEIVNYAKEHLPEEACGLLAGVETEEGREITVFHRLYDVCNLTVITDKKAVGYF